MARSWAPWKRLCYNCHPRPLTADTRRRHKYVVLLLSMSLVRQPLCLACALLLALGPCLRRTFAAPRGAQGAETVIIPVVGGAAFVPAFSVGEALVSQMRRGRRAAELRYFRPKQPAVETPDQARQLLREAIKLFELLDFSAVRVKATAALKRFKLYVKQGGDHRGYVRCLHLLSAAALFDGDRPAAVRAMNDAVAFSKERPSAKRFNPTVQQLYDEIASRSDKAQQGSLKIQSSPLAVVWLNRRLYGLARGRISARSGLYLVEVFRPGRRSRRRWFRIRANETRPLRFGLAPGQSDRPSALVAGLRRATEKAPGPLVLSVARRLNAKRLVVIDGGSDCTAQECTLVAHVLQDRAWRNRHRVIYRGNARSSARQLLAVMDGVAGGKDVQGAVCTLDSECAVNERCLDGRCARPRPITKRWWFWALIGAVAAGAAVGIALPLTRPDGTEIRVQ